jgi:hypothetical protein
VSLNTTSRCTKKERRRKKEGNGYENKGKVKEKHKVGILQKKKTRR